MTSDWAASALKWWSDAGVDVLVAEEPRDWLRPERPIESPPVPAEAAPASALPADLDAFQAWFVDGASLPLGAPAAPRIGGTGDPAADLMILIDMPRADDIAAGTLISGSAGALFDRMLAAIGRSRATIYLAPLSPLRTPTGRIDGAHARALVEIARHHVGLVKPKALLLFGDACAKALLGGAVAATRQRWHELDTPAGPVKTLATIRPEKLEQQPSLKKIAWDDLQMLMEGLTA